MFAWFMGRGLGVYLGFIVAYLLAVTALVRSLPRALGLIVGLVFLLAHYFAGCTWLSLRFDLGMLGPIAYAAVIATVLVMIGQGKLPGDCLGGPATRLPPP